MLLLHKLLIRQFNHNAAILKFLNLFIYFCIVLEKYFLIIFCNKLFIHMNLIQFKLLKFDEVLFIILKVEDNFTKIFTLNLHSLKF